MGSFDSGSAWHIHAILFAGPLFVFIPELWTSLNQLTFPNVNIPTFLLSSDLWLNLSESPEYEYYVNNYLLLFFEANFFWSFPRSPGFAQKHKITMHLCRRFCTRQRPKALAYWLTVVCWLKLPVRLSHSSSTSELPLINVDI